MPVKTEESTYSKVQQFSMLVSNLQSAFYQLGHYWTETDGLPEEELAEEYPFNGSFDETAHDVGEWLKEIVNLEKSLNPARYNVVKVSKKSSRKTILEKNLTELEAIRLVKTFPDSSKTMVYFIKQ